METQLRTNNTAWVKALRDFSYPAENLRVERGAVLEVDSATARELVAAGFAKRYDGDFDE